MATLEEYIEESRRIRDERRAQEETRRNEDRERYDGLLASVIEDSIRTVLALVPEELSVFLAPDWPKNEAGEDILPAEAELRRYRVSWFPTDFLINAEPFLAPIHFTTSALAGLVKIRVGAESFPDFIEAVAKASDPAEPRI